MKNFTKYVSALGYNMVDFGFALGNVGFSLILHTGGKLGQVCLCRLVVLVDSFNLVQFGFYESHTACATFWVKKRPETINNFNNVRS